MWPLSDNSSSSCGTAVISLDLPSTATWPSSRRCSADQAWTICSGDLPVTRSNERRSVLPSTATTPRRLSAKRCMKRVKQVSNAFGSSRRNTRLKVSWLSGSSGMSCGLGQERNAGLATRAMTAPPSPDEGMAVRVPVIGRLGDGLGDLVPGLEATACQGERTQHLPPRLDQVEVGGVFRLEHHLPAWMRQHEQQDVGGAVAAEVIGDGIDPLDLLWQPTLHLFQEGHPVGSATARVGAGEGGACRGTEGTEDVSFAAPSVVDLQPGPACRLRRGRCPHQRLSGIALGAEWPHLVQAND